MSSESKKCSVKASKSGSKSHEEIFQGFQGLRNEQRQLVGKLAEMEQELNEHKLVIETLTDVDEGRKCFRMVGGVLVERTVKEVLPALQNNQDQLTKVIETLNQQIVTKGQELKDYKEKYNIRIRGQDDLPSSQSDDPAPKKTATSQGVLVSNKS